MLAPSDSPKKNPKYFEMVARKLPLLASPKLDGIRCEVKRPELTEITPDLETISVGFGPYTCLSKTLTALPSKQVQALFSPFEEADGEILVGNETDFGVYNRTQSYVMSRDKPTKDLGYRVFDCADEEVAGSPFEDRLAYMTDQIFYFNQARDLNVSIVEHVLCKSIGDILDYEEWALMMGYEGVMLKRPDSPYKHGRGTFLEGYNYKLKREEDTEFEIIGFKEAMTNTNLQTTSATGHAKRSSAIAGLVGANTLGKFVVSYKGEPADVAPGAAAHAQRKHIWDNPLLYIGKTIVVRHFPHGAKDGLRHPRFIGFRDIRLS